MEKAIEDIVRTYLRQETDFVHFVSKSNFGQSPSRQQAQTQTQIREQLEQSSVQVQPPDKQRQHVHVQAQVPVQEQGTSTSLQGQSPEKPYGDGDTGEEDGPRTPSRDADSEQVQLEQDFMRALYQCLEEKGVLKEVQAFIRQRLVLILKGAWPNLVQSKCDTDSHVSLALIQDFLLTHKLLFTFSVFTSEVVTNDFKFREDFGKLRAQDVEALLYELRIPRDSSRSSEILKQYFNNSKGNWSLLECIIHSSAWRPAPGETRERPKSAKRRLSTHAHAHQPRVDQELSLIEKLKRIDDNFDKILTKNGANGHSSSNVESIADKRVQAMFRELERDKKIQINDRIQRFKRDEMAKIRDEIETLLKFEYLQKEKQLESKYEEKMSRMRKDFDVEREKLFLQKFRQGNESERGETSAAAAEGDITVTGSSEHIHGNFHQSLLAKYNDLVASALPSTGDQVKAFGLKRELERSYLLKEATLRNTIDRLKSENEELKATAAAASPTEVQKSSTNTIIQAQISKRPDQNRPPYETTTLAAAGPEDEDARAFLQYTVECQAEQISSLQKQINELIAAKADKESADAERSPPTLDLQEFLRNSKQRFSEIEQETQQVKARMRQLQALSSSVSPSPRSRPLRHEEVVHIPRPPPPAATPTPSWTRITASGSSLLNLSGASRSSTRIPERKVHFTDLEPSSLDNDSKYDNGHMVKTHSVDTPDGIDQNRQDHAASASETEVVDTGLNSSAEAEQKESSSFAEPAREKSIDDEHNLSTTRSSVGYTNEDASAAVQEPVVIARKAYLTGALVREKLTSSSSSSDEHSKSNAVDKSGSGSADIGSKKSKNGNGNIRNGNGGGNAGTRAPVRPKSPDVLPGFMPGRSLLLPSQDQERDLQHNRSLPSFELSIDDMQFETGKASSSDEEDGLW